MLQVAEWETSGSAMMKRLAVATLSAAALFAAGLFTAGLFAGPVLAGEPQPYVVGDPGPEAAGCYFSRGHMYCGRYCYWEINGRRYCQRRARDAYPQGDVYIEESFVRPGRGGRHHRHGGHSERLK